MTVPRGNTRPLGRLEPTDFEHVDKYPYALVAPATVAVAERALILPGWLASHDQGNEGSCVGHGLVLERSITNAAQKRLFGYPPFSRYDPIAVWNGAKTIDEWPETNPGDDNGTSLRAGYRWASDTGLQPVSSMQLVGGVPTPVNAKAVDQIWGVAAYRWATTVDEARTAIANGIPVTIGVNWYTSFDHPYRKSRSFWLPDAAKVPIGSVRGGHCICLAGVSDKRQAFRLLNSWGRDYPAVWLPYPTLQRLIAENGEVALVTDR